MAKRTLFPNGQVMACLMYIDDLGVPTPWDGSISVSSTGSAIEDGVTNSIKATVIDGIGGTGVANPLAVSLFDINGDPLSGSAVSLADGADVVEGELADAKVVGDNTGTVSAKLRGLNYLLALVTDTLNSRLNVFIANATLAVTQSGAWVLSAGSAIIGKVGIDQTTPGTTNGVVVNSSALPTGAATSANQGTANLLLLNIDAEASAGWITQSSQLGSLTETAPATDTASSGLNGRLQRVAQRLTSILTALGTPFQAGGSIGNTGFTAVGTIADDSPTPGAPITIGGLAKAPDGTDPGNVSAEDKVARFIADLNRIQYVRTDNPRAGHKHLDGSTAYTDESIVADPGDGFQIIITNIIASTGAATAMNFFLEEGSTKIFGPIYLEAVAGRGFASGPIRLPVTASTAVTLTSSQSIAQSFDIDYFIQKVS
jgi:hypothetical protein